MATASHPPSRAGSPSGNINDLFDYDVGLDEIFQTAAAKSNNAPHSPGNTAAEGDRSGLGLGLDEEVRVSKRTRQPIPKLDENRLLSQPGIPKLRASAKSKLKFKGKGHEFYDAERLLNFYQLWLDDLFPRAKFTDGLAIIEKLGHSKRMQTMRREWIETEKPSSPSRDSDIGQSGPGGTENNENARNNSILTAPSTSTAYPRRDSTVQIPPDVDTLSAPNDSRQGLTDDDLFVPYDDGGDTHKPADSTVPDDDELDALLKEQEEQVMGTTSSAVTGPKPSIFNDNDFDFDF